jgi:phosphoribosylglycinamide formyltransferase
MGEPILEIPIPLTHPEDDEISRLEERIHQVEHSAIVEGTRLAVEKLWKERNQ